MEDTGSSCLTPFYILFFIHPMAFAFSDDSVTLYKPTESIFLACGSTGSSGTLDYRTWIGDINSEYSPSEPENEASRTFTAPQQPPYSAVRLSQSQFTYTFNLTAGQKFIRLYFYSTSYSGFNSSKAFFSVKAGSFTLLSNFSASLTADALGKDLFFKEFCINVEEGQRFLNITLMASPDYKDSYAFINGIEIVSMPPNLYYTAANDPGFEFVGQGNQYGIINSTSLETLYRINVGGNPISQLDDTGMFRTWSRDDDYLTDARPSALAFNISVVLQFSKINNYTAPAVVYKSCRSMGNDRIKNEEYSLTWEFQVDSGFTYFLRLHFCEFQQEVTKPGDRVFRIYVANLIAGAEADIIIWGGANGVPIYRDYAVIIGAKGNEKKQNLSVALHPAPRRRTKYSDSILNGIEIFKVDNYGNLAGSNPEPLISETRNNEPSIVPQEMPSSQSRKSKNIMATTISIVGGLMSGFVAISLSIFFWRRFSTSKTNSRKSRGSSLTRFSTSKTNSRKSRGSSLTSDLCTHFSLSEIKAATNNFDAGLIIGVGGFGNVYKGFINGGATPVAIKRLIPGSQQGALEFQTEIEMLSQLIHIHLVTLIGYCNDDGEMILVYDFMARGTLRDHLYDSNNPPLPWSQRLGICIGAARGLQYLHTGAKQVIIHRDVKTTNILLDEKWVAKVSDFGLSKFGPNSMSKTHVSTIVKGSIGYLDPEYYRLQQLTEKSDVYSFGVVLLEALCARPPIIRTMERNQVSLAVWAEQCYRNGTIDEIVDPLLKGKISNESLNKFAEVAIRCLNDDGAQRPSMSDVIRDLEFAFQLQESAEESEKFGHEADLSNNKCSESGSLCRDAFSEIIDPQGR
ncbi:receptor-like protein kinase FERONIA isoform X2 [Citrus sinensis]|uniref:receptor-like protein kinase FERONIA isoform X2 n=1 Tax=Citrus sinensis TaxID=2711 RepID=UPI0022796249|nr:receptor-like protein kinase FERONIA isoform X2 [Citrus sinensis]